MKKLSGFTLIELMIAIAVIAILAAIAMTSYNAYILKSRRTDATAAISNAQFSEEEYRGNNTSYATAAQLNLSTSTEQGYYSLSVSNVSATGYTITATPVEGKSQEGDADCSSIQMQQDGMNSTYTPSECWR